jgi:hypothetical protein
MRAASSLWKLVGDQHGIEKRDGLWSHPDLMPTTADLDEPLDFSERMGDGGDTIADLDPIAELERTERAEREQAEGKKDGEDKGDSPS